MDMSQYRDLFVSEARGHIEAFNGLLVQLEKGGADQDTVNELFRHAHSLKGMAATMQFQPVTGLAHQMEELLGKLRSGEFCTTPTMIDLLLEGCDRLAGMVTLIDDGSDDALCDANELITRLTAFSPAASGSPAPAPLPAAAGGAVSDLDGSRPEQESDTTPTQHRFRQSDSFKSIRIRTETLDRLTNITGELLTTRHRLVDLSRSCAGTEPLQESLSQLSLLLRQLRDEVFLARMLPFSFVAERFPRLVRDLARRQGKEIDLSIAGREIELDRGILEEISEPLVHILRNAVDHGQEPPDERSAAGKPATGRITITVGREKDHAVITVRDDGRGMDPEQISRAAVAKGLINSQQAATLSAQEAFMLVCAPGFSTADQINDISGRGVGMDAVKNSVRGLGGTLAIDSVPGQGSRFQLRLPITVSIIPVLLAQCGRLTVAFPVSAVDGTLELGRSEILEENGRRVCLLNDDTLPLISLNRLLGQPLPRHSSSHVPVIVSSDSGRALGLVTDRILGQQEVFVKPLAPPLSRLRGATGGAIMGDGSIVFVMDIRAFGESKHSDRLVTPFEPDEIQLDTIRELQ